MPTPYTTARPSAPPQTPLRHKSLLAWSAWARVLLVLPALACLWLAVWWAQLEVLAP